MTTQLRLRIFVLFLLGLTTALALQSTAQADRLANARYNQLLKSTALTVVPDGEIAYYGTAWLVDKRRGWMMTAYHCTEGRDEIQIQFPKYSRGRLIKSLNAYGRYRPTTAKVIAVDKHRDLALVKVKALPSYFQPIKIADEAPTPGETVYTIGNPVSTGKIFEFRSCEVIRFGFSAVDTQNTGMTVTGDFLTIEGDVIGGFSGGAMINAQGEVVGVAAAGLNDTKNVGYIAHTELRKFFGLEDRYTRIADPQRPVVGDWIMTVYKDDEATGQGAFSFNEDGTYTMSKLVEHQRGRYAFVSGNLVMRAEGYDVEEHELQWDGKHRFTMDLGDQIFVFDRYGTMKMETNS